MNSQLPMEKIAYFSNRNNPLCSKLCSKKRFDLCDSVIYDKVMKQWTPEQIESFRKDHKLTRRALGELMGVTVSAVFKWERGLKRPSKMAQILLGRIEKEFEDEGR